jgi:hypothetical protein
MTGTHLHTYLSSFHTLTPHFTSCLLRAQASTSKINWSKLSSVPWSLQGWNFHPQEAFSYTLCKVKAKGVRLPQAEKRMFFSEKQASFQKDVECASGLLKKRFNIPTITRWSYSHGTLDLIMCASIILHNMIIDDERGSSFDKNYHTVPNIVVPPVNYNASASFS